jgi:hypothetical protein
MDLETLAREIAADQGITEMELRSGSRKRKVSEARRGFCRASVGELGYPAAAAARFLGVTTSAVVRAARAEESFARQVETSGKKRKGVNRGRLTP